MRTLTLNPHSDPEFDKDGFRAPGHYLKGAHPRQKPIKPKLPFSAGTDSLSDSNATTPFQLLAGVGDTTTRNRTPPGERTLLEEQSRVGRQYQIQDRSGQAPSSVRSTESQNCHQHVDHSSPSVTAITVSHHLHFFVSYPISSGWIHPCMCPSENNHVMSCLTSFFCMVPERAMSPTEPDCSSHLDQKRSSPPAIPFTTMCSPSQ